MRVKLAGFNVDSAMLKRLNRAGRATMTPETLSAAYARISRSPLPIDQLRKKACQDVEKARKSNQKIIFAMGHHSVAEHAVFNFDIMGISRLALEEIERFRLVSYTEKSQRYVTLSGDYILPDEIKEPALKKLFQRTILLQNQFYAKAFSALCAHWQKQYARAGESSSERKLLEGKAKEDARYILSLATQGQVGMTINARNLEHLFRRCNCSARNEVRKLAKKMHALVMPIAPSIILFPEPSRFDREANLALEKHWPDIPLAAPLNAPGEAEIVSCSENSDDLVLASFMSSTKNISFPQAMGIMRQTSFTKKKAMFRDFFGKIQFFDAPPREFEMAEISFQALISAANFAQLKRHRLATLIVGDYRPEFGNVVPKSVTDAGLAKEFKRIIDLTNSAYLKIKAAYGPAADYILTNSHCRCILMKMNLREMYHFVRLRDDEHAQWDIRHLAHQLAEKVKTLMPLSAMMLCGKSDFDREYKKIYPEI
ncbi:MAG: FAD-dependent thymidylate synthase [Candidatus Aminicenantes bacterium]|nr:FAD-dependent thymidylate synthase [Candidatus Aminicenantes bacterium]